MSHWSGEASGRLAKGSSNSKDKRKRVHHLDKFSKSKPKVKPVQEQTILGPGSDDIAKLPLPDTFHIFLPKSKAATGSASPTIKPTSFTAWAETTTSATRLTNTILISSSHNDQVAMFPGEGDQPAADIDID